MSQFVSRFYQPRFVSGLNLDDKICIPVDRFLFQPVEIAIQMNPSTCGDVSVSDLIRMTQVWLVFLSLMLPRN